METQKKVPKTVLNKPITVDKFIIVCYNVITVKEGRNKE